jgi:hypothetical protein
MPYEALDLSNEQCTAFEAEGDRFHGQLMEIRQTIRPKMEAEAIGSIRVLGTGTIVTIS